MKIKHLLISSFALCSIANWTAVGMGWELLEWISKPLLMPLLLGYWYTAAAKATRQTTYGKAISLALVFSFGGDVFLMLEPRWPVFFLLGLGSFLIAHIQYIRAFRQWQASEAQLQEQKVRSVDLMGSFIVTAPLVVYGFILYSVLYPHLDAVMQVAVFIYTLAIMAMALYASGTKHTQPKPVAYLLLAGALLFVLSDSCIAINKFLQPIPYAQLVIMVTYVLAQFLIVSGSVKAGETAQGQAINGN